MLEDKIQPAMAGMTFRVLDHLTRTWNRHSLPVLSTGRAFSYYRTVFFADKPAAAVLQALQGQRVLDIGCGLTPFVSDSMFQACRGSGVDFYGIDPKLARGFKLGLFDKIKTRATGRGRLQPDAPGQDRSIAANADGLPFDDETIDLILSCYLVFAWIRDEAALERIFREFHRVLKPGGTVKIFPAPHYCASGITRPGLRHIIERFDVQQDFFAQPWRGSQFPPAYMRTLVKRRTRRR